MPWKPEVFVEGKWSANGLVFATEEEARTNALHLFQRWTLTQDSRAVPSTDPVNYHYDPTTRLLTPVENPDGA